MGITNEEKLGPTKLYFRFRENVNSEIVARPERQELTLDTGLDAQVVESRLANVHMEQIVDDDLDLDLDLSLKRE